jgi:hypothetical protein
MDWKENKKNQTMVLVKRGPIFVLFENWRVHNGEMRAGGRISEGGKLVGKTDGESKLG